MMRKEISICILKKNHSKMPEIVKESLHLDEKIKIDNWDSEITEVMFF